MAHQAHNIPWTVLASNLKWQQANVAHETPTNLHVRQRPDQGKEITYFVEALRRNIQGHSASERAKYAELYTAPELDEVILDDRVARRITPTIQWLRRCCHWEAGLDVHTVYNGTSCQHDTDIPCKCPLPHTERRASAFLRKCVDLGCYRFFEANKEGFFNNEIVKTLLLHGEMDPLLRIAAHPRVAIGGWWEMSLCQCEKPDIGWDRVCSTALRAYICLNVLICFPETWDPASGRTPDSDYRRARCYQSMLRRNTISRTASEVATFPHRQFFDIDDDQFTITSWLRDKKKRARHLITSNDRRHDHDVFPYGLMGADEFLACEKLVGYRPDTSDISHVRWILMEKGLPTELANEILCLAGYNKSRTLHIPNDPLHPGNRDELAKYLKHCWQTLIRCDMLANALDQPINWQGMISDCIIGLYKLPGKTGRRWWTTDVDETWPYTFTVRFV